MPPLYLTQHHWDAMREHVVACLPLEACGFLAGTRRQVTTVLFIRNQAQSPVRFVMDPLEQLQAMQWMDEQQLDMLGIFHSHPTGPDMVSATDITEAAYAVVHVIWSPCGVDWHARGFWIEAGRASAVTLKIRATK